MQHEHRRFAIGQGILREFAENLFRKHDSSSCNRRNPQPTGASKPPPVPPKSLVARNWLIEQWKGLATLNVTTERNRVGTAADRAPCLRWLTSKEREADLIQ